MKTAPTPADEADRQQAVDSLRILDTGPEERFDRLTKEAAEKLSCPMSTISIIDRDREWYKSHHGVPQDQGDRSTSFCGHTITRGKMFVVEDASTDQDFADNPMVVHPPHVRFYAGITLHDAKTKQPVGAFCVKDTKPRRLSSEEIATLMELADRAEAELNNGHHAVSREPEFESMDSDDGQLLATRTLSHFASTG